MMDHFDFDRDYVLENERAKLVTLKESDLQELLPFSLHEPDLWKYSLIRADGEENLRHYLELAFQDKTKKTAYPFLVIDKRSGKVAGTTRFYDIQLSNRSLQLGYTWYGKEFQGTGLNAKCKLLLLEFAFEEMNMARVEFRADAANERSIAAMKKIGCKVEGILRSNGSRPDGTRRDSIVLSILENEWPVVKQQLSSL